MRAGCHVPNLISLAALDHFGNLMRVGEYESDYVTYRADRFWQALRYGYVPRQTRTAIRQYIVLAIDPQMHHTL